jgi:hypothetical protein
MQIIQLIVITILIFIAIKPIKAAEFCVGNATELRNALSVAESNNESDDIRIELGLYETNGMAFSYHDSGNHDLTISGGWIDFFGNDCGIQTPNEHFETIIDGGGSSRGLSIRISGQADLVVSDLTFNNGYHVNSGGGLDIFTLGALDTGKIVIEKNAFLGNEADIAAAFGVSGFGITHIRNNLILVNNANTVYSVSAVQSDATGIYFNNNTVYGNTSDGQIAAGVYLYVDGSSQLLVANNILNNNDSESLTVISNNGGDYYLFNNNLDVRGGTPPTVSANNINKPNRFESGFLNYVPAPDSYLVDAGRPPCLLACPFPTPFANAWSLGNEDILSQLREQGDRVDIGAFESSYFSDIIFWDAFD